HGEYVGHSLDGQIGTGGPRIKLDNVNGAIKITHAQDGLPLSPAASLQGDTKSQDGDGTIIVDVDENIRIAERARRDSERITRQAQRDAQRQVDIAMRDAQKEIEQAQRELVREQGRTQRVIVRTARASANVYNERFTAKETKTFAVSGAPRVTINTLDGQVTVHGWDKPEVSYTATKAAGDEETLKALTIQAQQQGDGISITAQNDDSNGSVSFDVYLPKQSTLHVSSGDGALNLDGVTGQITLRSGDGEIALDGNFNAVSARTGDGTITLSVPAGSSFTIETNAPDEISNEGFVV